MARQETFTTSFNRGPTREFIITYTDDSPERADAVAFFQQFEHGLFPAMNFPDCTYTLPHAEAQQYLDDHPIEELWKILTLPESDSVSDDDLFRLEYLPELTVLKIRNSRITDRGMKHIRWLVNLEWLFVASPAITDSCLQHLTTLKSLKGVDMQTASQVTRAAYLQAMEQLPSLQGMYPPRAPGSH